jgi:hypothetical protein
LVDRATFRVIDPGVTAFDDFAVVAIAAAVGGDISATFIEAPIAE